MFKKIFEKKIFFKEVLKKICFIFYIFAFFYSVTFTERDGTISLDGCGADFDWLPGVSNPPDPYIIIRHNCNGVAGEILELPEFNTFVPDSYDLGIIELDSALKNNKKAYSDYSSKKDFPKSVETKHNRLLKSKEVTSTSGVDLWNSIEDSDLKHKEMDVTTKDSIQNKEEYKITDSDADLFPSFNQPDVIKLKNLNKK